MPVTIQQKNKIHYYKNEKEILENIKRDKGNTNKKIKAKIWQNINNIKQITTIMYIKLKIN